MTTALSVNLNKIALLRNSRGRDFPNVCGYAKRFIELGADGITVHPRQDERHIKRRDVYDLAHLINQYPHVEFNIEGNPTDDFLRLIEDIKPHQCTLVPDDVHQLTSDHGWDVDASHDLLADVSKQLSALNVRGTLFMDAEAGQMQKVAALGYARIELYTEDYAHAYATDKQAQQWQRYAKAAYAAQNAGLGVNAGHDLDLNNLAEFLKIDCILEVSIGHALTVECIEHGIVHVMRKYLDICHKRG